jgi:hypothetical protein
MNAQYHARVLKQSLTFAALAVFFALSASPGQTQEPARPKFSVKVQDEKAVVVDMEDSGAIDPTKRINFTSQGNFFCNITTLQNQILHLSHFPNFMINGRFVQQGGQGGRFEVVNGPLPKGPGGKARTGTQTVWVLDNLRVTQTMELHPSKSKGVGQKRLMNNVLITYTFENKGAQPQNIGMRVYMDTYVIDNDGCLFAAPVTHPGKILDGVVLQEKTLPPYLQMLQRPDLKNPGYVAHLSLNVGSKYEKANKLILTRHGVGFNVWEMPAIQAMFDSAIGIYWPVKELKAGGKREIAYAYGEGIAVAPESEGRFQMALGGSFEPGKVCSISAVVADPSLGQTLTLDLPKGMQRLEGKEVQPVAALSDDHEYSTVLWKARVVEPGAHTIRIRSSTGVTLTKIVTITAEK